MTPTNDTNFSIAPILPRLAVPKPVGPVFRCPERHSSSNTDDQQHNLELQLLSSSSNAYASALQICDENHATNLKLSIGSCSQGEQNCTNLDAGRSYRPERNATENRLEASRLKEEANEKLKLAMFEKAQQAQAELERAQLLKEKATKKISSTILLITCHSCKQQFQATTTSIARADETSLAASYMSSATTTEGD
ncbi:Zinc finger protein SHOOT GRAVITROPISM 5 [Camellia lanceoleosa]|uniref:Zinc finger protein SHOOT GRAVITROPISM 5 n=1 Tax=Camellia lanceoleosa TaxID=1840588 RepID=A0ACC0IDP1_9ERIC|nr:Zinc finger protein SHOOT GRAVITROPISM 5 [Camellia lanceoleosa]